MFSVRCQLKFRRSFRNKNNILQRDHDIRSVCLSALLSSRVLILVHESVVVFLLVSENKSLYSTLSKGQEFHKNRIGGCHTLLKAVN